MIALNYYDAFRQQQQQQKNEPTKLSSEKDLYDWQTKHIKFRLCVKLCVFFLFVFATQMDTNPFQNMGF